MQLVKVKLRGSGQIVQLMPKIAYARIGGGTAELVDDPNVKKTETAAAATRVETATAPAQTSASKPTPPTKAEPEPDKKNRRR